MLCAASAYALTASAALADGFKKDTTPLPRPSPNGASGGGGIAQRLAAAPATIARMVVGLAIVLAVVYGVYWLLKKRYRGGSRSGGVADGRLEIVATTPLASNRAVHLLRAGDELLPRRLRPSSPSRGLARVGPRGGARASRPCSPMPPPQPPQPTTAGRRSSTRCGKLTVRS